MPMDTKQYIADHLNALLKRMQLEDITVKALVEDCQISRQTFYYHFQDLMDVIQWSIHQALDRSLQKSLQAGSLEEAIGIFVSGAAQNRDARVFSRAAGGTLGRGCVGQRVDRHGGVLYRRCGRFRRSQMGV